MYNKNKDEEDDEEDAKDETEEKGEEEAEDDERLHCTVSTLLVFRVFRIPSVGAVLVGNKSGQSSSSEVEV